MSYLHFDFPHTRNQDSDLSQIIELYRSLTSLPDKLPSLISTAVNDYFASHDSLLYSEFRNKFANKRVLLIGDSISNLRWSTLFSSDLAAINASLTNISYDGACLVSAADYIGQAQAFSAMTGEYDIVIVFIGVNDYYRQYPIGNIADTSPLSVFGALYTIVKKCLTFSAVPELYIMSPIKNNVANTLPVQCNIYRAAYYTAANMFGFNYIDGSNAPYLNVANLGVTDRYLSDGTHPDSAYELILYRYIINSILNGGAHTLYNTTSHYKISGDNYNGNILVLNSNESFFRMQIAIVASGNGDNLISGQQLQFTIPTSIYDSPYPQGNAKFSVVIENGVGTITVHENIGNNILLIEYLHLYKDFDNLREVGS